MSTVTSKLDVARDWLRELGPLRFVVVYVGLATTLGTVALLANLSTIAEALPQRSLPLGLGMVAVIAALLAGSFVLPSAAAFAAGYLLGAGHGCIVTSLGAAFGSLSAQRAIAPLLGASMFAFMQQRPRATAARRFCGRGVAASTVGVARLRWAGVMPMPVTNLVLAVVGAPVRAVLLGSVMGAVPSALFLAVAGDCWRAWRTFGEVPQSAPIVGAGAALLGAVVLRRASRRLWRAAVAAA